MSVTNSALTEKATASFLAAAIGDALGWPFEGRGRRIQTDKHPQKPFIPNEFIAWTRSGSRSEPFREGIQAGEYSDDTQLLLSTARSLLSGEDWFEMFAFIELPAWLLYERGGGGATKRAAQSWLSGKAPWDLDKSRSRYFEAGGNGVCMRILPHVLNNRNQHFSEIANGILTNGACTHGHPRALVGALLQGMTLWLSLHQNEMLEYGALVEAVHKEFRAWASLTEIPKIWSNSLSRSEFQSFKKIWDDTVNESMELVDICRKSLQLGPLAVGPETLHKLGALNPKTNGSGTITAVAALFLASRYAAAPLQGVQLAATTIGADTDTLASMTGSILGVIHGEEWLGNFIERVQDSKYIKNLAFDLASQNSRPVRISIPRIGKAENNHFANSLKSIDPNAKIEFPDGRKGIVSKIDEMFSQTANADLIHISLEDGQTLAIKRIVRGIKNLNALPKTPTSSVENILRVGIKLFVDDLTKARDFYVNKLRFPVDKEYQTGFTVAGIISLHLKRKHVQDAFRFTREMPPQVIPCIRVAGLSMTIKKLTEAGVRVNYPEGNHSYKAVHIVDPFGNTLELFEA